MLKWPAEKTNLQELHEPFMKMVKELSVTGTQTAKDMYGTRGWMAHHNTDLWRATGAVDGAFWGAWINGGRAWPGADHRRRAALHRAGCLAPGVQPADADARWADPFFRPAGACGGLGPGVAGCMTK